MLSAAEARRDGRKAGKAAASWLDIRDAAAARRFRRMLDDGDPQLDDYLPRRPDLSGEFAGESLNEVLGVDDGDAEEWGDEFDDHVDEIAEIWQEAADEAFDREIERTILVHAGDGDDDDEKDDDD